MILSAQSAALPDPSSPGVRYREHERLQVLEMLSHVNKRVRDHREIGLPLPQLVALFQASSAHPSAWPLQQPS